MSPEIRKLLSPALIILGCIAASIDVCHASWLGDECYQALSVRDYRNAPLAMLSFAIGHLATELFGDQLLTLRFLRSLCYITAIGAPCLYIYRLTHRPFLASAMFFMLCCSICASVLLIFNWDIGSYPFLAFSIIALLHYLRRPSAARVALAGFTMALAVMSRLPLAVLLPVALAVICICRRNWRPILADSALGLGAFLATAAILAILMCGSIEAYVDAFAPANIITGHSDIGRLKWRILAYGPITLRDWLVGLVVIFAAAAVGRFHRNRKTALAAASLISAVAAVALFAYTTTFAENYYACGFLHPLWLALSIISWRASSPRHKLAILVIAAYTAASCVGSDTWFQRPGVIYTIPLLAAIAIHSRHSAFTHRLIALYSVGAVAVFAVQTPYAILSTGHDLSAYPHLRHLHASPLITDRFDAMRPIIDSLDREGAGYIFTGPGKYEPTYVFRHDTGIDYQLYHYGNAVIDSIHANHILQSTQADNVFVINVMSLRDHHLPIARRLLSHGYSIAIDTPYFLMLRRNEGTP